jgi:hypothetical protein
MDVPDPSGLYLADPANPQQLNLYAYVGNDPLRFTDPLGLDGALPTASCSGIFGCVVGFLKTYLAEEAIALQIVAGTHQAAPVPVRVQNLITICLHNLVR